MARPITRIKPRRQSDRLEAIESEMAALRRESQAQGLILVQLARLDREDRQRQATLPALIANALAAHGMALVPEALLRTALTILAEQEATVSESATPAEPLRLVPRGESSEYAA